MVVYLPVAFLKDWLCRLLKRKYSKSGKNAESMNSPLEYIGAQQIFEIEPSLTRKDSEEHLSSHEEGRPLVTKPKDDSNPLKHEKELTTKQIATYGFYIAPIWFVTEVNLHFTQPHSNEA